MSGGPDPLYVRARSALLDAVEALEPQLDAFVLVGAQAIYLRAGDADLAVAEYTTDADFAIGPADLTVEPLLANLLTARGFSLRRIPGAWVTPDGVAVDLMVPEKLAGSGSRAARLGVHGTEVARRAKGLEGALVDRDRMAISSLDPADVRTVTVYVAGPGALLIAKVIKIDERVRGNRLFDKDALDVLRLLRAVETSDLTERIGRLRKHDLSSDVTAEAIGCLDPLFGTPEAEGVAMATRASGIGADAEILALSMTSLVQDLLKQL